MKHFQSLNIFKYSFFQWKSTKTGHGSKFLAKSLDLKKTSHQISRISINFGCIGYKFNDHVTIGNKVEICFGRLNIVATLQNWKKTIAFKYWKFSWKSLARQEWPTKSNKHTMPPLILISENTFNFHTLLSNFVGESCHLWYTYFEIPPISTHF